MAAIALGWMRKRNQQGNPEHQHLRSPITWNSPRRKRPADMLNSSFLILLLDEGMIGYRQVGTHRRVRF